MNNVANYSIDLRGSPERKSSPLNKSKLDTTYTRYNTTHMTDSNRHENIVQMNSHRDKHNEAFLNRDQHGGNG